MNNNVCLVITLNDVNENFNSIDYSCEKVNEFIEELRNLLEYEYSSYSFATNFTNGKSEMKIFICYNELENEMEKEEVLNSFENILFSEQLQEIIYTIFETRESKIDVDNEMEEYDFVEPQEYVDPYNDEELMEG